MKKNLISIIISATFAVIAGHSMAATTNNVSGDQTIVARESTEAPRGSDNHNQRRGRKAVDDSHMMQLAREGNEAPRGSDNHNQRRGGKAVDDSHVMQLAREGNEAPRGSDNHNQRRGGKAIETLAPQMA